jgi:hypothetical protein
LTSPQPTGAAGATTTTLPDAPVPGPAEAGAEASGTELPSAGSEFVGRVNLSVARSEAERKERLWAEDERLAFWDQAARRLTWEREWDTVHTWKAPSAQTRRGPEFTWYAQRRRQLRRPARGGRQRGQGRDLLRG